MSRFEFSLLQFGVALSGALLFLVLAVILMKGLHPALERGLAAARPAFSWLDRTLALNVARWIGLDESKAWRRWARLLGVLLGSAAIGALLPPILGAPLLAVGLTAVLAVFRRWAWDEEDRAAGLGPDRRRAPGAEDYNNELVVALAAVFMLGSLLVWRLTGLRFFSAASGIGLMEYLVYVASETLEAMPIIGNVEVLGYDNPSGVEAVLPTGGWVAFILRMALDLLVIGGLLQVLAVARRIARGQDLRRHEEVIHRAEPRRLDETLRTLGRLGMGGDPNAIGLLQGVAADEVGGPHTPPARVQALHQLSMIAQVQTALAPSIKAHRRTAARELLEHPDLEASGYKPVAFHQLYEEAEWSSHRHHGQKAVDDLTEAATSLAHAIVAPGHSALPDGALADPPRPMTQEERASLIVAYAGLLLTAGEWSQDESARVYFERGAGMIDSALGHLDAMEDPHDRAEAWRLKGQLLSRLGAIEGGRAGEARLNDALAAYDEAEAALGEDPEPVVWLALRLGRGVTHEILGRLGGETALDHFAAAADLFAEAAAGFETLEAEAGTVALALVNQGNASLLASEVLEETLEADEADVLAWIDRALESFMRAAVLAMEAGVDRETIDANDGIARASLARHRHDGESDHLMLALSSHRVILTRHDERSDPAGWALAALACSEAELVPSRGASSGAMALSALQRLERARPILARFRLDEAVSRADDLSLLLRDIAERLERGAGDGGEPEGLSDKPVLH